MRARASVLAFASGLVQIACLGCSCGAQAHTVPIDAWLPDGGPGTQCVAGSLAAANAVGPLIPNARARPRLATRFARLPSKGTPWRAACAPRASVGIAVGAAHVGRTESICALAAVTRALWASCASSTRPEPLAVRTLACASAFLPMHVGPAAISRLPLRLPVLFQSSLTPPVHAVCGRRPSRPLERPQLRPRRSRWTALTAGWVTCALRHLDLRTRSLSVPVAAQRVGPARYA